MGHNPQRKHRADDVLVDLTMKRLYDTLEPSIISNKLLKATVYEQGPREEAGRIARAEGIAFSTVKALRLDFKNILYINNLSAFTNLTKLQLVNNIIERIENLDHLIHLEWLDLSFNKIEKIEGLDKLTKLMDLSLYYNRITILENMDNLVALNVFSIGKNELENQENLLYLRKFKKLHSLNLAGNPLCQSQEYFKFIFAFFPKLMFLDYKLVTEEEHQTCYEQYLIRVERFKEKELEEENKIAEQKAILESRKTHCLAFVELLDTDALFTQIIDEDPERESIFSVTGVEDLTILFKEKFVTVCQALFAIGIEQLEKRQHDSKLFYDCINAAKTENNQRALDFVAEFNITRNGIINEMNMSGMVNANQMNTLKEATYDLWNYLMSLEVQLYDQLEETIRDYSRNLSEMIDGLIEIVNGFFSQLRDMENTHTERIGESAMVVLEKILKGDMEEDRMNNYKKHDLFNDKDSLISCLSSSHEHRLLKIDTWEDTIKINSHKWLKDTCDELKMTEEYSRNRNRITEINNFVDHIRSEIENCEIPGVSNN